MGTTKEPKWQGGDQTKAGQQFEATWGARDIRLRYGQAGEIHRNLPRKKHNIESAAWKSSLEGEKRCDKCEEPA